MQHRFIVFNPFHATHLFWYPLKTENQRFSNVFRGYQKRSVAWYGLMILRFFGEAVFALLVSLKLIAISQISCCSSASRNDDLYQKIGNCKNTCIVKYFKFLSSMSKKQRNLICFCYFFEGVIKTDLLHS